MFPCCFTLLNFVFFLNHRNYKPFFPVETESEFTEHLDVPPPETGENKPSAATDESPLVAEEEVAPHKVPEIDAAIAEKKPVRGRRAKVVESQSPEDKVTESSEIPVLAPTAGGRRGKKAGAAAPPAVRQTKRGRNAKSEDQPTITSEAVTSDQPVVEAVQETVELQALPKEADTRPTRGRKNKTPTAPPQPQQEETSDVIAELPKEDVQPQQSIPAPARSRRGRQTTTEVEQTEAVEDTAATVKSEQPSGPPVRAKRGRNAKQVEKPEEKIAEIQEPVKKSRRTRNAEEDQEEQKEEQMVKTAVSDQTEAPETVKAPEQVNTSTKPRRGGRKAKSTPESETPVEVTDVKETSAAAAAAATTEKPRRGRRAKTVTEEAEVTAVVPETADCEPEDAEATTEPEAQASKPSRGRQTKKAVPLVPAKRARRGAAPPDLQPDVESTDQVSEVPVTLAEPPKRGRRATAKPSADNTAVVSDQATPTKASKVSAVKGEKIKKGIQWKTEVEVFEIPTETPVKAVRGRRPKAGSRVVTEEKDLSDEAETQPAKRAKRNSKISNVPADTNYATSKKEEEPEAQPKTRRGRSARK